MEPLHNRQINVPEAEQSSLLCSNIDVGDCSASGFIDSKEPPVEVLVDQLAELIVKIYFHGKRNT